MKANELQIGDYVNYRGQIIKVTSLYDKGGSNEVGWSDKESVWVNCRCIEPIPLTSEILEKNGFVNVENTQTSTIIYSFRDSLFRIGVFDFNHITIDSYYTDSSCDIFISSIHELQHALRLCGIEKEIEL